MIQIDKKPGRKPLRRNGEEAGPVQRVVEPAPTLAMTRVRMLRGVPLSKLGSFAQGRSYMVPHSVARHWINIGLAEEDKSLEGPPETK